LRAAERGPARGSCTASRPRATGEPPSVLEPLERGVEGVGVDAGGGGDFGAVEVRIAETSKKTSKSGEADNRSCAQPIGRSCQWNLPSVRYRGMDHRPDEDFAEFYEQARAVCLRAVYAAVGDWSSAEDVTAEAFARAYASWGTVCRHPAPRAWVVRTALNTHISWWRRHRWEVAWDASHDAEGRAPESAEIDRNLMRALTALPIRQREVVALRIFLDLDTATTARALDIAPGTVMTHLSRALAALRAALAPVHDRS
jgi:RNA polymerase sigma factor (sigma-70 family)